MHFRHRQTDRQTDTDIVAYRAKNRSRQSSDLNWSELSPALKIEASIV